MMNSSYRRILVFLAIAALVAGCGPADDAAEHGVDESGLQPAEVVVAPAPDFDLASQVDSFGPAIAPSDALQAAMDGGVNVQIDTLRGVPTFLWLSHPLDLDGNNVVPASAGGVASTGAGAVSGSDVRAIARGAIDGERDLYGLSARQVANLVWLRTHDVGDGGIIVQFQRRIQDLEVHGQRMSVILRRSDLRPVAISGFISPHSVRDAQWADADVAVGAALDDLGIDAGVLQSIGLDNGYERFEQQDSGGDITFGTPARAKRVLYPGRDRLVPAWYVEVDVSVKGASLPLGYGLVIADDNQAVLQRTNLVHTEAYTYRVWAHADGSPMANPLGDAFTPYPQGRDPLAPAASVPSSLVTVDGGNVNGDPWLPDGSTFAEGNHVRLYADVGGAQGYQQADDLFLRVSSALNFDYPYDFDSGPFLSTDQQHAGMTHMFFVINHLHDLFYDYGFDELAGNAQESNFGRGGSEGDRMNGEALDYSGTSNANMFTPSDGSHPRMQMYRYTISRADTLSVTAPMSVAGNYPVATGGFPAEFDVSGDIIEATDDGTSGDITDGCDTYVTNVTGQVALVNRGNCTFIQKATQAQAAGAIAVIIANNDTQNPDAILSGMSGFDASITIGAGMVSYNAGQSFRNAGSPPAIRLISYPDTDGGIDSELVAHEWGHYLYGRLTAEGSSSNQRSSMNEGNSDFVALLMSVREEQNLVAGNDQFQGAYPIVTYAGRRYQFGTRRYPYSTDFGINPLTFKHIDNRIDLPTNVPISPKGADNAEVHNAGEVWANTMWECYAGLINTHPFDDARNRMLGYEVAGLSMFPPAATFTEGRDAFLAAMFAADRGDFDVCWQAFARRGMGVGAVAPARFSSDHFGVVESYEVRGDIALRNVEIVESTESCDEDEYLDAGEFGEVRALVSNTGAAAITGTEVELFIPSSGNPNIAREGIVFPNGPTVTVPPLEPGEEVMVSIRFLLESSEQVSRLHVRLIAKDPTVPLPRTANASTVVNADELLATRTTDDFESRVLAWTVEFGANVSGLNPWVRVLDDNESTYFNGPTPAAVNDVALVSPPFTASSTEDLIVELRHRYSFEYSTADSRAYDGGIIEVSADGQTWIDVTFFGADPQYGGTIVNLVDLVGSEPEDANPLSDYPALVGQNPEWPAFQKLSLNFGTSLSDQTVQIRFRVGSDVGVSDEGWDIDDVALFGVVDTPFPEVAAEDGLCTDTLPVAVAGASLTVNEGDEVTLDGVDSYNPFGEPLDYSWSQTSGPAVTLSPNGSQVSFTAPNVDQMSTLALALVVSDSSRICDPDPIGVIVMPVNEAPTASVEAPATAAGGASVVLDGTGSSDPEGDALTYFWTQLDGTPVALAEVTSASPSFVAPAVAEATELRFRLVVSDGQLLSEAVEVTVAIELSVEMPEPEPEMMEESAAPLDATVGGAGCECSTVSAASSPSGWPLAAFGMFGVLLWWRRDRRRGA